MAKSKKRNKAKSKKHTAQKIPERGAEQKAKYAKQMTLGDFEESGGQSGGSFVPVEIFDPTGGAKGSPKAQKLRRDEDERYTKYMMMQQLIKSSALNKTDIAGSFYETAVFLEDYEDNYEKVVPFNVHYPSYQHMTFEQFRAYFTWRTYLRHGKIIKTSASYILLYFYELLNNIGVDTPQEGLDMIMQLRRAYKELGINIVDSVITRWISDYYVYYVLPKPFNEFLAENGFTLSVPGMQFDYDDDEELFIYYGVSNYNIKNSAFYNDGNKELTDACMRFVFGRFKQIFSDAGADFDALIRRQGTEMKWSPFSDAIFYEHLKQPDRRVALSPFETFYCRKNKWYRSAAMFTVIGGKIAGYIIKQTEALLRSITKFKYKIKAGINMLDSVSLRRFQTLNISPEKVIKDAVSEFYAARNRTVVSVDKAALEIIRKEALEIQEKLTVELPPEPEFPDTADNMPQDDVMQEAETAAYADVWTAFRDSLTDMEKNALTLIINGGDLKRFAGENNVMTEVLADGINQKAYDTIGDAILGMDGVMEVYEDYRNDLTEVMDI